MLLKVTCCHFKKIQFPFWCCVQLSNSIQSSLEMLLLFLCWDFGIQENFNKNRKLHTFQNCIQASKNNDFIKVTEDLFRDEAYHFKNMQLLPPNGLRRLLFPYPEASLRQQILDPWCNQNAIIILEDCTQKDWVSP